ncbi:hypothetical protein HELRODRAFT_171646 [Helobdella robusta]|uniref:Uncharacterized protein n=1 Tax=Helobdella robusta TaxID=6412 RepID=T1F4I4_HELRO|nr:hypothetical protein HELRODRAFT_171646 [Helobdella robusta]ESO05285.1 hypothetical protein HELRODRAFT_171646 [Helobdella robusta]
MERAQSQSVERAEHGSFEIVSLVGRNKEANIHEERLRQTWKGEVEIIQPNGDAIGNEIVNDMFKQEKQWDVVAICLNKMEKQDYSEIINELKFLQPRAAYENLHFDISKL